MGRVVYKNLKSALSYLITVHIPIAVMSVIPVFFNLPLILLPAHIAFLHLIIEPTSSIAFESSDLHEKVMREKPRPKNQVLFDKSLWLPSLMNGAGIMFVLMGIYLFTIRQNYREGEIRACVFSALIASNIYLVFSSNGLKKLIQNKLTLLLGVGSIFLLSLIVFVPSLQGIFMFSPIGIFKFTGCFLLGFVGILVASLFTEVITPQ
jgi:Ca2+-transporting ATPase